MTLPQKYRLGKLCKYKHEYLDSKQSLRQRNGRNKNGKVRYDCVECLKESNKKYYSRPEVKEYRKEYWKEYHSRPEVKEHRKEYKKEYMNKKYNEDPVFRTLHNIAKKVIEALNGKYPATKMFKFLGYTLDELKEYISWQIPEGADYKDGNFVLHHYEGKDYFDFYNEDEAIRDAEIKRYWKLSNIRIVESSNKHIEIHNEIRNNPKESHWSSPYGTKLFGRLNIK